MGGLLQGLWDGQEISRSGVAACGSTETALCLLRQLSDDRGAVGGDREIS